MKKVKLAEALLRRKELNDKVARLGTYKEQTFFNMVIERQKITDDLEEVRAAAPRASMPQVMAAYDWHAKQLRRVDAAIQQANWSVEVELEDDVMSDYDEPEELQNAAIPIVSGRVR